MGIVFQFFNLIDDMTALENVAIAGMIAGVSRKRAMDRATELLDLLGLIDKVNAITAAVAVAPSWRAARLPLHEALRTE